MDHTKISGGTQKCLPEVPQRRKVLVERKDGDSEESVFVIQKPEKAEGSRVRNGERCQRLNDLWARKEPWSGV